MTKSINPEQDRIKEKDDGLKPWQAWGPYVSERQWGTVREDYSADGNAWEYFPHDHARSRVYRWGEDAIAGICDEMQRICFGLTLWNGQDTILKERLFGLNGIEGNHGEDVKELYYHLDNVPSHAYMKYLYRYPHQAFPYQRLVEENRRRNRTEPEFEITDTGIFAGDHFFDITIEYAKFDPHDVCIRIRVDNRSNKPATIVLLPTLWLRNTWSFNPKSKKPVIMEAEKGAGFGSVVIRGTHSTPYFLTYATPSEALFTENETNTERLFGSANTHPGVKDSFHHAVIENRLEVVRGLSSGTKFSPLYRILLKGGGSKEINLRLSKSKPMDPRPGATRQIFRKRIHEKALFYQAASGNCAENQRRIFQQAISGLLWNKQFYYIDVPDWLRGDKGYPAPPRKRLQGRNHEWKTLNNKDILLVPDKWEYPWYAAWDLAFHCVTIALVDAGFAKAQLGLFLREWYMHPNGQLPAYEWNFGDVNPPLHAWSCLKVYNIEKKKTGKGDIEFLETVYHKLLLNFTWWVNRKDHLGRNIFEGGFLGLDNIGLFDRSQGVPGGGRLQQADGTSWMAMYCLNMLEIAVELAQTNPVYENMATKFLEHFVLIADSLNSICHEQPGAWDEKTGFFFDLISFPNSQTQPVKVHSIVGMISLFAVYILDKNKLARMPEFYRRLKWFRTYRQKNNAYLVIETLEEDSDILLSLAPRKRLERLMEKLVDEEEFLAPGGIRSLSKKHRHAYQLNINGTEFNISYVPGESDSGMYGGNSNWRGPVWLPINYLLIQSLRKYGLFYESKRESADFTGMEGHRAGFLNTADEISRRIISMFDKDHSGRIPVLGGLDLLHQDASGNPLLLFHEYFDGDTSKGLGASHQAGWTALVANLIWEENAC